MRQAWRGLAGLLAIGALATGSSVALADGGHGHGHGNGHGHQGNALAPATIFTMPAADGPPEGVAFDKSSGRFFVSRTGTGAIFSGTLDNTTLQPFIPGVLPAPVPGGPPVATGLKVRDGKLYVAGASTGQIRIYDLANPTAAPVVFETGGGFINDLDLDGNGDVFATDSNNPAVYKISAASVAAGAGPVETITTAPEIPNIAGAFNLNGIVARSSHELIVVQSETGQLFRIKLGDTTATRTIEEIDLGGKDVKGGDGLLFDRGRLLVGRGSTPDHANGAIDVVKLRHHRTRGEVENEFSDPSFQGPSTLARARGTLLVVNPNFAGAATATQFTVSGIDRHAVRGHGHGHGGGSGSGSGSGHSGH